MFFVRSGFPFNYDAELASEESGLECKDVSRTKQSFGEEVDINTIVRRFHLSGELPKDVRVPQFGDYEGVFDFHSAMNVVAEAREAFDLFPGEVRARFHHDPQEMLAFIGDEKNYDEAVKLGIVNAKAPVKPVETLPAMTSGFSRTDSTREITRRT